MLDVLAPIAAACDISVAPEHRLPIAIVGAGSIVDVAHLPAYRSAGLEVRGFLDLDTDRAREVAERHGVPTVYVSLDELLADPGVRVVDIAVEAQAQSQIALRALEAGKHLLCQKPFVLEEATGEKLVAVANGLGLKITVNQQLRYDEGTAAARAMVHAGWIGEPTAMTFTVDIATDWTPWPWLVRSERLEIMYHSIHYLDAVRSVLATPRPSSARAVAPPARSSPGRPAPSAPWSSRATPAPWYTQRTRTAPATRRRSSASTAPTAASGAHLACSTTTPTAGPTPSRSTAGPCRRTDGWPTR